MFRTIGDRPSSWELPLPAELLRLPGELARVDALLDDPAFFAPFAPYFHPVLGRPSTPVECYLRLMFLKFRYRLGYESLCAEVSDSVSWRRFCRIGLDGRVPHPTTLLDGWTAVERLLEDLAALEEQVWLVIDDLHELGSAEALRQLELLIMRAPAALRFVLVARRDLRLGLHRLRLAGELTEIRADDLRFSRIEAHAMLNAAGVALSDSALDVLYGRTEGWAAGLRLAALSLAGHLDPERFAAEFGGSERTVAEYPMAEVLERQPEQARQLLLRTSILPRVNGELADLLTGGSGGERVLQQLEGAGAFVISLDARRSWFRYHQLFADLLQLELRGTRPAELPVHELLTRFTAGVIAADAELAARVAGTSWRGDRWKRPNGAWLSPPGHWSPFPRTGAAAPR